jgi:F0F1-type ATP synthase membrane subunit b/b'
MVMDNKLIEMNNKAKMKLIELYERYIEDPSDEFIQNAAVDIGNEFSNATDTLLNEIISKAVNKVDNMAFGEVSIEEAKKILNGLKEID